MKILDEGLIKRITIQTKRPNNANDELDSDEDYREGWNDACEAILDKQNNLKAVELTKDDISIIILGLMATVKVVGKEREEEVRNKITGLI